MDKEKIDAAVDKAFAEALSNTAGALSMELYPAAFANEYSWLRVQAALDIRTKAIKAAIKSAITEILNDM